MRVQIILYQTDLSHLGVVFSAQRFHKFRVIHGGPSFSDFDIAKAGMRLKGQEHTAGPLLFIFIMVAFRFPGTERKDRPRLFPEETGTFIKVD